MDNLALTMELVPEPLWHTNLRYMFDKKKWQQIRLSCLEKNGKECKICKYPAKILDCHEVWAYDDKKKIQKLADIIPLCKSCHLVKHPGFAMLLANEGKYNFDKLIRHFLKINGNGITEEDFMVYMQHQFEQQDERNQHKWTQDISFIYDYDVDLF